MEEGPTRLKTFMLGFWHFIFFRDVATAKVLLLQQINFHPCLGQKFSLKLVGYTQVEGMKIGTVWEKEADQQKLRMGPVGGCIVGRDSQSINVHC